MRRNVPTDIRIPVIFSSNLNTLEPYKSLCILCYHYSAFVLACFLYIYVATYISIYVVTNKFKS